ncbi:MAG: hypothetical protein J7K09_00375 [Desulfuromusa sp.]|nr:hypothetical protein [Desulfuromusa sp.]
MSLLFLKIIVSAGLVLTITFIAERASIRLAGVLLGFPLGAGLSILFFGIEQGASFTAKSALWGIPGVLASLTFVLAYLCGVQYLNWKKSVTIICCTLLGIAGFFVASLLIYLLMPKESWLNIPLTIAGVIGFAFLFRKFPLNRISVKVPVTPLVLGVRAGFTALVVLLITGVAQWIGPQWSGLLSTFPVTLLPVMVILHHHYGTDSLFTLLRELPFGLLAIVVFDFSVAVSFPILDVAGGMLVSYGVAFLYLLIYELKLRSLLKQYFFAVAD